MSPLRTAPPKPLLPVTISGGRNPHLDAVCRTAAALFGVRYAFVSHLDAEYQWYIGSNGHSVGRMPRAGTFCTHMLDDGSRQPLVVLDAQQDPRFAGMPFVCQAPHIRFYAGMPTAPSRDGRSATVCVADVESRRRFGTNDERRLRDLTLFVEAIIEARMAESQGPAEHALP